jgi:hypothetical protein
MGREFAKAAMEKVIQKMLVYWTSMPKGRSCNKKNQQLWSFSAIFISECLKHPKMLIDLILPHWFFSFFMFLHFAIKSLNFAVSKPHFQQSNSDHDVYETLQILSIWDDTK